MTNEEILANEQDIDQKIQVKLDEFFNHASAVQVEEGTWYYQDVSVERELSDAYKTAFQMQRRIVELEKRIEAAERELSQKQLIHVGYTNGNQIYYAKNDESGSFYPDTENECYIPLYMLEVHLHRIEAHLSESEASELRQQLNKKGDT